MPSTYSQNNGITLQATGENSGTWGAITNDEALQIIDRALDGFVSIALSGTTSTLAITDGTLSNGQYRLLLFTGSLAAAHTVTVTPNDAKKVYYVRNSTTGGFNVILAQGGGSGTTAAVPPGYWAIVRLDGSGSNSNASVISVLPISASGSGTTVQGRLAVIGEQSNEVALFQGKTDLSNNRSFITIKSTNPDFWWEVSLEDTVGGGTSNGIALRERSISGSSVVRFYINQGGTISIPTMPGPYADRAAAIAGGLSVGNAYETSAGALMRVRP